MPSLARNVRSFYIKTDNTIIRSAYALIAHLSFLWNERVEKHAGIDEAYN